MKKFSFLRGPMDSISYQMRQKSGQGALAYTFLVGGLIVLAGLTLAFLVISFTNSSFGFQAANRALAAASSGIDDAIIRLVRDNAFGTAPNNTYAFSIDGTLVSVILTRNMQGDQVTITSSANVVLSERRIRAVVALDPATGQVSLLMRERATF